MPASKISSSVLGFLGLVLAPVLVDCSVEAAEIPGPAQEPGPEVADPRATVETEIARGERPADGARLYVAGGESADGVLHADVWSAAILADGSLGPWQAEASLPEARSGHALVRAGVTTNGTSLLVLGGEGTAGIRRDGFVASLSAGIPGAFAETMPIPGARARFGAAYVGPFVFAVGGEGESGATADVFVGRSGDAGAVARWDVATSLPKAVSEHAVVASGDHLFVLGGEGAADVHVSRIGDDGSLGAWRAAASLPSARGGHCVVTSGATIFAIGGTDAGGGVAEVLVTTLKLDGSIAPWRTVAKLPDGRARLGCAVR